MVVTQCSSAPAASASRRASLRRALALLTGLAFCVLFLGLGRWQLQRAEFKAALAAAHAAAGSAQPLPPSADAAHYDGARVVVSGKWLIDRTVWIDNRTHAGRAGVHVLTPLALADGSWLFVNRGWAPMPGDRRQLPLPSLPSGAAQALIGVAVQPATGGYTLAGGDARDALWSRIDVAQMQRWAGAAKVYPLVLQLESNVGDGLVREWAPPAFGPEKHRGYALQWFLLAALTAGLTLWFGWRSLRRDEA